MGEQVDTTTSTSTAPTPNGTHAPMTDLPSKNESSLQQEETNPRNKEEHMDDDDDDDNLKVTSGQDFLPTEDEQQQDDDVPVLQALFQVILLVINPHAHNAESEIDYDESSSNNESTLFELLQVQVFHMETTIEDLLEQIPRLATKRAIRRQLYRGVIGNPMIMKSPSAATSNHHATHGGYLLFPNSIFVHKLLLGSSAQRILPQSPVSSSSPDKTNSNSNKNTGNYHPSLPEQSSTTTTIVLVPLPEDVSVSECAEEALTILHDPSVRNLLSSHGVDTSTWNIHSPMNDSTESNFATPLSPIMQQQHPSSLSSPTKSPEEFYAQIATDITDLMTKQQQQQSQAYYGPLLIGWACQSAVSYYYLSLATQGIGGIGGTSKSLHFRKALLRKQQLQQQKHHHHHDDTTSFSNGGDGGNSSSADDVVIDPAMKLLDSIYEKFHHYAGGGNDNNNNNLNLSYVDLYTLGGVVAVKSMGGPTVPWIYGRSDYLNHSNIEIVNNNEKGDNNDEKKDNHQGSKAKKRKGIGSVFTELGFTAQEIVALSGANALARCYPIAASTEAAPHSFQNTFFVLLEKLSTSSSSSSSAESPSWKNGPFPYSMAMDDMGYRIDLVPSDVELIDPEGPYYEYVRLYAKDDNKYSDDFALAFFKLMHIGTVNLTSDVKWWKSKSVEAAAEAEVDEAAPGAPLPPAEEAAQAPSAAETTPSPSAAEATPALQSSKSSKKKKKKKKKKSNQN